MIDTHVLYSENWGILPVLFKIGGVEVSSYTFFVTLGVLVGVCFYFIDARRNKITGNNVIYIFVAAMFFGALGAKIPIWLSNWKLLWGDLSNTELILSGRTVIGGLIGGAAGVVATKKILKIKMRMGNQIAPAAALGISIGRLGCFFRGCCYGVATNLPWGVNFGDGILRHPTQIYEAAFNLLLFLFLLGIRKRVTEPGKLFGIFISIYFTFRFFMEFIRVSPVAWLGLTWFQVVCLLAVLWVNRRILRATVGNAIKKGG